MTEANEDNVSRNYERGSLLRLVRDDPTIATFAQVADHEAQGRTVMAVGLQLRELIGFRTATFLRSQARNLAIEDGNRIAVTSLVEDKVRTVELVAKVYDPVPDKWSNPVCVLLDGATRKELALPNPRFPVEIEVVREVVE